MQTVLPPEPGFVIHTAPFKEHEGLIDFLTLNYGRVSGVVRFPKKGRNSLKAILQPYLPLEIEFTKGSSEMWRVTGASVSPVTGSTQLQRDLQVPEVFFAQYLNELLYFLYRHQGKEPLLFASYMNALQAIHKKDRVSLALREFEKTLLTLLGYEISFVTAENDGLFEHSESYLFSPERGFIKVLSQERWTVSDNCYSGRVLDAIARGQWHEIGCLGALREIFAQALSRLLNGRVLHSKELYFEYQRLTEKL